MLERVSKNFASNTWGPQVKIQQAFRNLEMKFRSIRSFWLKNLLKTVMLADKKLEEQEHKEIITTTVTKMPYTGKLDLLLAVTMKSPWVMELGK